MPRPLYLPPLPSRRTSRPCLTSVLASALLLVSLARSELRADVFLEPEFNLVPGWNLIHLPVEPIDKDPLTALQSIHWESLWTWLPAEGEPRGGRWLVRHRDTPAFLNSFSAAAGTSSLFSLAGPASYLLHAPSGGTLRIRGVVRAERQPLLGNTLQLFGPRFAAAQPPTFAAYFLRPGVREHVGAAFELQGPSYRRLQSGDALRAGAAYWLLPDQTIPAPDPLRVRSGLAGLRFDAQTSLQELVLDVGTREGAGGGGAAEPRTLRLRVSPSTGSSSSADWLELLQPDGSFAPIGEETVIELAPEQSILRLAFRARREGVALAGGVNPAVVLDVSAPEGSVTLGAELDMPGLRGIWMGEALIAEVERPSFHGGGFAPAPAVTAALLLEIPSVGSPRLLPCVTVESSRDGRSVNQRIEAALVHETMPLAGTVTADGTSGNLVATSVMSSSHPLNPYRHRYHPEHSSGYEITRSFRLRLGAELPGQPAAGEGNPFLDVGTLRGVYEEEILGLAQEPIRVRGTFRLRRLISGSPTPCTTGTN